MGWGSGRAALESPGGVKRHTRANWMGVLERPSRGLGAEHRMFTPACGSPGDHSRCWLGHTQANGSWMRDQSWPVAWGGCCYENWVLLAMQAECAVPRARGASVEKMLKRGF